MDNVTKIINHSELKQQLQERRERQEGVDFHDDIIQALRHKRRIIDREMDIIDHKMNRVHKMEKECGQLITLSNKIRKEQADK